MPSDNLVTCIPDVKQVRSMKNAKQKERQRKTERGQELLQIMNCTERESAQSYIVLRYIMLGFRHLSQIKKVNVFNRV